MKSSGPRIRYHVASSPAATDWASALNQAESRFAAAIASLRQDFAKTLGALQERVAVAERLAGDLAGQIRELR